MKKLLLITAVGSLLCTNLAWGIPYYQGEKQKMGDVTALSLTNKVPIDNSKLYVLSESKAAVHFAFTTEDKVLTILKSKNGTTFLAIPLDILPTGANSTTIFDNSGKIKPGVTVSGADLKAALVPTNGK